MHEEKKSNLKLRNPVLFIPFSMWSLAYTTIMSERTRRFPNIVHITATVSRNIRLPFIAAGRQHTTQSFVGRTRAGLRYLLMFVCMFSDVYIFWISIFIWRENNIIYAVYSTRVCDAWASRVFLAIAHAIICSGSALGWPVSTRVI